MPPEPSPLPPRPLGPRASRDPGSGDSAVPLRLAVARGALGIELYRAISHGPLSIEELTVALPGLRFPIDLSGGVAAFRHRRGDLSRLRFGTTLPALARWLRPRVKEALGRETQLDVWWVPEGVGVGVSGPDAALGFDLVFTASQGDARLVVMNARAAGIAGPALGQALRLLDSVLPRQFERRGRLISVAAVARHVVRAILPEVGVRAPSVDAVRFGLPVVDGDDAWVALDSSFLPPPTLGRAARALGLAGMARDADDALAQGDVEGARTMYLRALDRAPRDSEIVRLIAELDALATDRAEAALGLLSEVMPVTHGGAFVATLLARAGDVDAAKTALEHALAQEIYAPLAALQWAGLACLVPTVSDRLDALGRALACSPSLVLARWARFELCLSLGDLERTRADAAHIEALAPSPTERHLACMRVADAYFAAGVVRDALRWYERALRYVPDDPSAIAGLGRTLRDLGRGDRAYALLLRAAELAEERAEPAGRTLVDLGRLMAEQHGDLPQGIACVRRVPLDGDGVLEARYLEGRWRATLGDLAGASLSFARLRDSVELGAPAEAVVALWLVDAAEHEQAAHGDLVAAERHLAVALRVAPRHERVVSSYRDVAGKLTELARRQRDDARRDRDTVAPEPLDGDG